MLHSSRNFRWSSNRNRSRNFCRCHRWRCRYHRGLGVCPLVDHLTTPTNLLVRSMLTHRNQRTLLQRRLYAAIERDILDLTEAGCAQLLERERLRREVERESILDSPRLGCGLVANSSSCCTHIFFVFCFLFFRTPTSYHNFYKKQEKL